MTKITTDALAQEIRRVDGNHSLGAGALAEALMPFLAARLASTSPAPDGWQPIDTAPKDGTRIAVKFDNGFKGEANWQTTYGGEWHVKSFTHLPWHSQPTHWMPQVAAPQPVVEKDNG